MSDLKIAIGSDHGGFNLKTVIAKYLGERGYEFKDFGIYENVTSDYPLEAKEVARAVAEGGFDRGIIVCGTGLGVAIAANKVKGIRAAAVFDSFCARRARSHNDTNVLCLGERVVGMDLALDIVDIWLNTEFEGGRHQKRVDMIN